MRFDVQVDPSWPRSLRTALHRLVQVLRGYHREGRTVRFAGVGLVLEALDPEPAAPSAGRVVLYATLAGGKLELRARFPSGEPVTLAREP